MDSDKNQVYIAGPWDGLVAGMFLKAGWAGTNRLEMADLVVFTGGADIDPGIYNEKSDGSFPPNKKRDELEIGLYHAAKNWGIPMVGICRGAQLLNALNGGTLWQDVDNHTTNHSAIDVRTNKVYTVTSTHHQQMRVGPAATLVAAAYVPAIAGPGSLCTKKRASGVTQYPQPRDLDTEVVWYNNTNCLCFQPHPEYPGNTQTAEYFWDLFKEFFAFEETQIAQESA